MSFAEKPFVFAIRVILMAVVQGIGLSCLFVSSLRGCPAVLSQYNLQSANVSISAKREKMYNNFVSSIHLRGRWWRNGLAGFVGTAPMTAFMLFTQSLLPKGQQYALPPEIITRDIARRIHLQFHLNKGQVLAATTVAHFGYGSAMGILYQPISKRLSLPGAMKGAIFGLLVWTGSYLALLPASGISESAHQEPLRRNLLMIGAHVIWGATLGIVARALENKHLQAG